MRAPPPFDDGSILCEDEDLLVVDKPFWLATHAPEPGRREAFERLSEGRPYLGLHQRLDRGTSGVLLFTRRREVNAAVAAELEGRRAEKRYVAVVEGRVPDRAELWHRLERRGHETHARALAPRELERLRGRPLPPDVGVTALRVLERQGGRALVELAPKTGRTHQLRAQLAALGAPIVGDAAYGGAEAFRPMLHAASLALALPSGRRRFEAPLPGCFARALAGTLDRLGPTETLGPRVLAAAARRAALWETEGLDAFRLANAEGDELPGVELDRYGDDLVLGLASDEALAREPEIVAALAPLGARAIWVKRRPKHASTVADAEARGLAPREPVVGAPADDPWVREGPLAFAVELGGSLSTGLFLDQRDTRARVRELASGGSEGGSGGTAGKRVLNLFCYTASFTVAAVAGGAAASVSVDVSQAALDRARRNLDRAGADPAAHRLVRADALVWLDLARQRPERWDVIVLDPPSFSTTKTSRLRVASDYPELVAKALRVAAEGATVLCLLNHAGTSQEAFRRKIHEGAGLAGRALERVRDLPEPLDFPSSGGRSGRAKGAAVVVGAPTTASGGRLRGR